MDKYKTELEQSEIRNQRLNVELSETTFVLKDTLEANDKLRTEKKELKNEVKELKKQCAALDSAVRAKKALEEMNTKLLKEQKTWKDAYEETILAFRRHFKLCQC